MSWDIDLTNFGEAISLGVFRGKKGKPDLKKAVKHPKSDPPPPATKNEPKSKPKEVITEDPNLAARNAELERVAREKAKQQQQPPPGEKEGALDKARKDYQGARERYFKLSGE
jgi:hypothetical protein